MAEVSNEVKLIVALWKEKLSERKDVLAKEKEKEKATANTVDSYYATREMEGIEFAENHLAEIISKLEKGKL